MTFSYTRTAAEIVKRATQLMRVGDPVQPISAEDMKTTLDALNGFTKYL